MYRMGTETKPKEGRRGKDQESGDLVIDRALRNRARHNGSQHATIFGGHKRKRKKEREKEEMISQEAKVSEQLGNGSFPVFVFDVARSSCLLLVDLVDL